jgi:hypothetical protein
MHQQATERVANSIAVEAGTGLLLASAQDSPSGIVALHSLHAERGLFALKGCLPLPPEGLNAPVAGGTTYNTSSKVSTPSTESNNFISSACRLCHLERNAPGSVTVGPSSALAGNDT